MKKIDCNQKKIPIKKSPCFFLFLLILAVSFSSEDIHPKSPLWSDPQSLPTLPEEVAERENIDANRKAGFPDYEIDALHAALGRMILRIDPERIPEGPGNFKELTDRSATRKIIRGTDGAGKNFYRIRIREGKGYSTEIYPELFTYRVDCFLYPGTTGLDRVIFQFYRINHGTDNYVREMRRFIHSAPGNLPETQQQPPSDPANPSPLPQLGNNGGILVEYYEAPTIQKPDWYGSDGVPIPVFTFKPKMTFILIDDKNPMPYNRQVTVIRRYKTMLRSALASMESVYRAQELEKGVIIEKVMDF